MHSTVVAIDIGGTFVRVALCDESGKILAHAKQTSHVPGGAVGFLEHVAGLIRQVAPSMEEVLGIGIGIPGLIEPQTGTSHEAWNIPEIRNVQLRPYFESEFCVPIFFGNDASLAGLGEHRYGAGQGTSNMVYMTIGTGVGGGIVVNNRRLQGARGLACEVGEQVFANPESITGTEVKSLEDLVSGPNIAKRAARILATGRESLMLEMVRGDLANVTSEVVADAAEESDAVACEVLGHAAFFVGLALVNLIHIFNTDLVVLGGGVMMNGDLFLRPIRETVEKYAMPYAMEGVRITLAALGDNAGLLGGVALVLDEVVAESRFQG